ncbi:IclR family transcriptional regulator [Streptomyces gilvifuscus]|uniref:Helix-turn-helix domain-containing protein n=1 Tax=Streptomyces gilvifuscus TaxID=1550617 RepID=A0ABT5G528_9ACTN|nr:helix-turn-helix domain-containing protein [Streptomyces gilvifuscus]MDC2959900.1 helix-turn-helix domain-containing protein [Streptomyces gilvifuscus]
MATATAAARPRTGPPDPAPSPDLAGPLSATAGRGVLEGAFALLDALHHREDAGVTTLASACGLPKTTAYRLLDQLVELGAVERSAGRYRIGPGMFRLGQGWQPYPGLREAAQRPLRRLAAATGTTATLAVLYEGQTLILDRTGTDLSRPVPDDRRIWPWYTATGKVLAAWAGPGPQIGPLPRSWPDEAVRIRESGVAYDREEVLEGVCCAAVPVFAAGRVPVAALGVLTGPDQRLERLAETARRAASAITTALRRQHRPAPAALGRHR